MALHVEGASVSSLLLTLSMNAEAKGTPEPPPHALE